MQSVQITSSIFFLVVLAVMEMIVLPAETLPQPQSRSRTKTVNGVEVFHAELFLNANELNSGLYDGTVRGRRRFGNTQIPHGRGIMNYFTTDKFHRLNYTGDWRDGTREGNGTTYFKDGSVYEGEYKDGVEDGLGKITYANGNILEGEFKLGKIHGHAVFRYPDGDQREGFFRDNVLDGQVIFTAKDGRTSIEVWRNGKRVQDETKEVKTASEAKTVVGTTARTPTRASGNRGAASTTAPRSTSTAPPASSSVSTVSLDELNDLRKAIKAGDKAGQFFFPQSGSNDLKTRNRQPKLEVAEDKMATELREKSQTDDQNLLMSIFLHARGGRRR